MTVEPTAVVSHGLSGTITGRGGQHATGHGQSCQHSDPRRLRFMGEPLVGCQVLPTQSAFIHSSYSLQNRHNDDMDRLLANGQNLEPGGLCSWCLQSRGDHLPILRHDRAHRHLTRRCRTRGQVQREAHRPGEGKGHRVLLGRPAGESKIGPAPIAIRPRHRRRSTSLEANGCQAG